MPYGREKAELKSRVEQNPDKVDTSIMQEQKVLLSSHSGPLPPPDTLKGYAEIDPSFPERIMKMAEENNAANISHEKEIIKQAGGIQKLGTVLSFVLGMAGLCGGIVCGVLGFSAAAISSIIGGVAPVLIASIRGVASSSKKDGTTNNA